MTTDKNLLRNGNILHYRRNVPHPLDERPSLWGHGPSSGDIPLAIISDAPTKLESDADKPFPGSLGKFFNWGLGNAELYRPRLWLTYVLSCRPPSDDLHHPNAVAAIDAERSFFRDEVRYLVQHRGLKVILAFGELAASALGVTGSLPQVRGSVYVLNTRTWKPADRQTDSTVLVVPTYHPQYLLRNRWNRGGRGRADFTAVWLDDLSKARRVATSGWSPPREHFNLSPTLHDVESYVTTHRKQQSLIAVDIETTGFDPAKAAIVCVGLAHSSEDALVVPFLTDGGNHYWNPGEARVVTQLLSQLLSTNPTLFQNALFDVPFLRAKGIRVGHVQHDTLLLHHAVSPELPHKLGFIVSQYGDTPYWKDEFQNRDTTIVRMDQTVLRRYNARDCVVLHQVLPGLLADLDEIGARDVYESESIALIEPIIEMMTTGVVYNPTQERTLRRILKQEHLDLETQLRTLGQLPPAFNLSSDDDLRLFLWGVASSKYDRGEQYTDKKPGTKVRQQLEDLYSVRHETRPLYEPTGFRGRRTDTGKATVNKQGRLSYQRHLQRRLADIRSFKKPHPRHIEEATAIENVLRWLELYQDYTEIDKIQSTYLSYPVNDDGRVHTKYIVHGTATGRLASREPNLQNLPKRRSKDIRRLFVAPPGHVILAADYSNLEVKVMAYETSDPILIDIVDNGKNMHDLNTETLFHLTPDDPLWEPARRAAKIFMFGSLAYGGGDNEIYEKVIIDVPELQLTFREFQSAKQRYMDSHPVYVRWRDTITDTVRRTRQVKNAFGRVRTFYGNDRDIVKEALNFPIQSAAASIINRATVAIHRRLRQEGLRTRLQAQIHDELRFEVPEDELPTVARIVHREMTRPIMFYDTLRTFDVEMEAGPNWADLAPLPEGTLL